MDDKTKPGSAGLNANLVSESPFGQLPIEILVSVGKAQAQVGKLLELNNDSVLVLDQNVDDPVELYVGTKLIGRGELQELEGENAGKLVVRLTEVASLKNGI